MAPEVVVQLFILILAIAMFFAVLKFPKKTLSKIRSKDRTSIQSTRHCIYGSNLLTRSRSCSNSSQSKAHAKNALTEAEKALSLSPRDAGPHILKAMALDLMGHKSSALRSLEVSLSSPCVKSLSKRSRKEALVKRAELKMEVSRKRRLDSAIDDLLEAERLGKSEGDSESEVKVLCSLGKCYEWKGMKNEACEAFEKALIIEPESMEARQGLNHIHS